MIYLHIGTDKTGSTAIQKLLKWNTDILKELNILYPESGQMHYDHARLSIALDENKDDLWLKLHDEIINFTGDVISSHEGFYNKSIDSIHKIKQLLPSNEKVKVIIYFRRQDLMIESGILQLLKNRESFYDLDFISENPPSFSHLNYLEIVNKWSSVFGEKNIILRPYDSSLLKNRNSIYLDFLNCINVSKENFDKFKTPSEDTNPSLDAASAYAISFLYKLGIKPENHDEIVDLLLAFQKKYEKSLSSIFSIAAKNKIMSEFSQSNNSLASKMDVSFLKREVNTTELPSPDEVSKRLKFIYENRKSVLGCYEWFGEGKLCDLVRTNRIKLLSGFHNLEDWGVWVSGEEEGILAFKVPRTIVGNLNVKINCRYLGGSNTKSYLAIGDLIFELSKGLNSFVVKRMDFKGNVLTFSIKTEFASSPHALLNSSNDRRVLGVGLEDMKFIELAN